MKYVEEGNPSDEELVDEEGQIIRRAKKRPKPPAYEGEEEEEEEEEEVAGEFDKFINDAPSPSPSLEEEGERSPSPSPSLPFTLTQPQPPPNRRQQRQPPPPPSQVAPAIDPEVSARMREIRPSQDLDKRSPPIVTCWKWRQALPRSTDQTLLGLVDEMYRHYMGDEKFDSHESVLGLSNRLFPAPMDTPHGDISRYARYYESFLFELWSTIINRKSLDYDNNAQVQRRLVICLERLKLVTQLRQNMALIRETADESRPVSFSSLDTLQLVADDTTRLNPYQQSLLIVLNECYRNQYCRRGENIYERVYHGNQFTHTYQYLMPMSEFVYSVSGSDKTSTAWETLTSTHNIHKQVIEHLSNCVNSYLPVYAADRHMIAFRNGVYSTLADRFWQWSDVPAGSIACNFIDQVFDYFPNRTNGGCFWPSDQPADSDQDWWEEYEDDWFKIPTPFFDKIFRTQVQGGLCTHDCWFSHLDRYRH